MSGPHADKGRRVGTSSAVAIEVTLIATAIVLLWASSLSSYLLFHSIIEVVFIAVGVAVFVMAWNLRSVTPNGYAVVMGTGLLFASALQLLHALTYKGMGVFPWADADLPTQLWIAARYLTAATFVAATFFFARSPRVWLVAAIFALLTTLLSAAIFWWKIFPACYVEDTGLTAFKRVSEYVIAGLFVAAAALVIRRGRELSVSSRRLLVSAMVVSAVAEITFTRYIGVYTFPNLLGHLLMFVSVYLVYRGVVTSGMARTYRHVVDELGWRTAKLETLSSDLESRVAERTAELKRAVAELETISYSISHELRSPLRAIDGFSLLALEEGREVLSPQTVDGLERSRAAAQHMGDLIDDLLDIMKLSRLELEREDVDLSATASAVAATVAESQPEVHTKIDVRPGMSASADPTLTRIVLHNVFSNAMKFSSRESAPAVTMWPETGDGATRFFVRDNGIGFDKSQAERIFEPFCRLVRQDEFPGTGVGLAIVRRIVSLHGGHIEIRSSPGEGTTICFTLEPDGASAARAEPGGDRI